MAQVTKMSSKRQMVPRETRKKLKLVPDISYSICLNKIETKRIKTWKEATKPFREAARKSGFNEDSLNSEK